MSTALQLVLGVAMGAAVLLAALIAAWRLIPRNPSNVSYAELDARVEANRTMILDLIDRYETGVKRQAGRARQAAAAAHTQEPDVPRTKEELRAAVLPRLVHRR